MGGHREGVRADLVGHVAVGGDAIRAHEHDVDVTVGHERRRPSVHHQLVRDPELLQLPRGEPGALSTGRVSGTQTDGSRPAP